MRCRLAVVGLLEAWLLLIPLVVAPSGALCAASGNAGGGEQGRSGGLAARLRPSPATPWPADRRVRFTPLGALLSGTAQLNGHVYAARTAQEPLSGVEVGWWVSSTDGSGSGTTTTDDAGAYSLYGVAAATGNGGVWVMRPGVGVGEDSEYELSFTDRTWTDASISTYDFEPSQVYMYSYFGGPWFDYQQQPWLTMRGSDSQGGVLSYTEAPVGSAGEPPDISSLSGPALAGTYTDFCLNFWSNEGAELTADVAVPSGWLAQTDLTFDQASAQRLWEVCNYTPSGDPGAVVKLRLQNFPVGEVTDFYGYQYEPVLTPLRSLGSYTALDVANQYKKVAIPKSARPGQDCVIFGHHRGGLLDLEVYFQVTRLKGPSSARGSYRLTGQVPIRGYDGSPGDTGARKYVYLFRRFAAAAQPKGNPIKQGWKFVRRYRTTATGKFSTASMDPGRTAWYVVYYPADKENWDGFTAVRRVRHR